MTKGIAPDQIMQLGTAFWASKALLSAVEFGVFTELAQNRLDCEALRLKLGIHSRSARDFFDALLALGMLEREDGSYRNTAETDFFLDRAKPSYIGGILEMCNARLYGFWGSLSDGLRTGEPQNETKSGGNFFEVVYSDPSLLRQFLKAMTGVSMGAAIAMAQKFPWGDYKTVVDVGCAEGCIPVQLALAHPHLTGGGFDLPPVKPIFDEYASSFDLNGRIQFHAGDFFVDDLPGADVLVMGQVLHDWNLEEKKILIGKAYAALPDGGAFIVHESLIDDERRTNAAGLLMSLNMLIEVPGGFDFTGADCMGWMREVGFKKTYVEHLVGPASMVVGIK